MEREEGVGGVEGVSRARLRARVPGSGFRVAGCTQGLPRLRLRLRARLRSKIDNPPTGPIRNAKFEMRIPSSSPKRGGRVPRRCLASRFAEVAERFITLGRSGVPGILAGSAPGESVRQNQCDESITRCCRAAGSAAHRAARNQCKRDACSAIAGRRSAPQRLADDGRLLEVSHGSAARALHGGNDALIPSGGFLDSRLRRSL